MNRFGDTDDHVSVSHKSLRCCTTSQRDADQGDNNYGPLENFEIDDTQLDLFVVDERTKLSVGRPWLTLKICAFTKRIVSYYLSQPESNQGGKV
jgi:hypothetical protein